jgi:hypothetical protein
MADKKISQLTGASTPLAGTEVLPIVQSGSTVKVASNDLTVKNVRSNATTGILQVAGPAASTTRVMTTPDANFTVARTDASNSFTGTQIVSGNVGINTTPNTWLSGFSALQIPAGSFAGYNEATLVINQNAYFSAATSDNRYVNTGFAESYAMVGGEHIWSTAPSNTAGSAISFTQRAKIDVSGNFVVDTGNVIVGTAAKGIDFSANTGAAGETSSLLDWYEEGTYTVTLFDDNAGGNASATTVTGRYSRVGNIVHCTFTGLNSISTAGMTAGNTLYISLPFTPSAIGGGTGSFACENFGFGASRTNVIPVALASQPRAIFRAYGSGTSTASLLVSDVTSGSANIDYFSLTYQV